MYYVYIYILNYSAKIPKVKWWVIAGKLWVNSGFVTGCPDYGYIYICVYYTYHMYYICIYYHVFLESPAIEYIVIHYGSWWVPYQKLICFCWMVTGKLLVFIFRNTVWLWVVMGGYRYGGGYTGQLLLVKKTHIPQFRV